MIKQKINRAGYSRHPLYAVWIAMNYRCSKKCKDKVISRYYYDKDIRVCDEWKKFEIFFEWAYKSGYKRGLVLDRINGFGNYEPSNCRFVNWIVSSNNRPDRKQKVA